VSRFYILSDFLGKFIKNLNRIIMKKVILLGGLSLVMLASCKKEYSCYCCDLYDLETDCYTTTKKGKDAVDACELDASDALTGEYCEPA
jgi:hypothetical protein